MDSPSERHDATERQAEDDDLQASITALGTLATGHLDLEELLTSVAVFAVRAIPGADGAGLTLLEDGRSERVVTTAPFVREVDDLQYGIGQGPCISAADEGRTMRSGSLGTDGRWPEFGPRVAGLGVHSAVSLPLITPGGVVGALNVYAHAPDAFTERAAELGQLFARPAAIAVQNAQVLAQARRLVDQLQTAADARAVVDRAVGIMMSRTGRSEEQALNRLRLVSRHEHRPLPEVAQTIVDEAVSRARTQRLGDGH